MPVMYPEMKDRKDPDAVTLTDRAERISLEGNINNRSGIIKRPIDDHIRGFIRIPDGYRYEYEGVQLLGMVRKELGNDYEVRYGLDWIYPSDE